MNDYKLITSKIEQRLRLNFPEIEEFKLKVLDVIQFLIKVFKHFFFEKHNLIRFLTLFSWILRLFKTKKIINF